MPYGIGEHQATERDCQRSEQDDRTRRDRALSGHGVHDSGDAVGLQRPRDCHHHHEQQLGRGQPGGRRDGDAYQGHQ